MADSYLLEVTGAGAHEDDGVVAGGGGRDGGQVVVEHQHRDGGHRRLPSQRRVHVQSAEVLSDRLQLLQHGNKDISHHRHHNQEDRSPWRTSALFARL